MPYHKVLSNQYCSTVPAQFRPLNKNMSTYSFALGAHAPTHERTVVYRFHRRWGWIALSLTDEKINFLFHSPSLTWQIFCRWFQYSVILVRLWLACTIAKHPSFIGTSRWWKIWPTKYVWTCSIGGEFVTVRPGSLCPLWFWIRHCKSAQTRGSFEMIVYEKWMGFWILMLQGSGVQAIDEEIKKYTTLSYRLTFT